MFKQFNFSKLYKVSLLVIAIIVVTFTICHATYWRDTFIGGVSGQREGSVWDSDSAEESSAYAYACVDKNYKEFFVRRQIIFAGTCPLGSQCPFEFPERPTYCDQCRVSLLVRKVGTEVDTMAQVSCSYKTEGVVSDGSWSLYASEHLQPSRAGSVFGSTHENHYDGNFYEFKLPDELTGKARGRINPARWRSGDTFKAETEKVTF